MKSEKVLTIGDVAKICNVSAQTAQKWFDEGLLKGYKLPNSKDRRVLADDLKDFMAKYEMPWEDWLEEWQEKKRSRQ
jgi:predicted site-specific integrase-resolvase